MCYKALDLTSESFNVNKIKHYIYSELSYAILAQIEYYSFILKDYNAANLISTKLINIIEEVYYDPNLPTIIPNIIYRTYINMLNNKADSLFCECDYESSLEYLHKAISSLKSLNNTFGLHSIYFLACENFYKLEDIEKANEYLAKSVYLCLATDKNDYIQNNIKPKIKDKYLLLSMPNI